MQYKRIKTHVNILNFIGVETESLGYLTLNVMFSNFNGHFS
jgi:hypothetical protein